MGWTHRVVVGLVSVAVMAAPADALAVVLTPPGKSGADQYFETLPASGGNAAPPTGAGPAPGRALGGIGQGGRGAAGLTRLGHSGQAALRLAAATAPASAGGGTARGHGARNAADTASGSATSGLTQALTGSDAGGIGLLLPVLMLVSLLAAIAFAVGLRQRPTQS